jgi:LysR family transcriptional regulator, transcriptional activator of nhaA
MEWLNYHHLLYFWTVVREGGIAPAADKLRLAPPTISEQLKAFQLSLGEKLFIRPGRKLELTEMGQTVFSYADEIFRLGHELVDAVHDRPTGKPLRFTVGIVDAISKQTVRKLLEPIWINNKDVRILCHEGRYEKLLPDLVLHALDMLLVDNPVPPSAGFKVFNHLLIESGLSLVAAPKIASKYRDNLPQSLNNASFLLTTSNTSLRRGLDEWFIAKRLQPNVVAEFEDSGLLAEYGMSGYGIFAVPSFIEQSICKQLHVKSIIRLPNIKERFYAVTAERHIDHPAIKAVFDVFHKE